MPPQLAFVGLGLMGRAMTKNLVAKGKLEEPLILYNRTASRAEEHSAAIGHSIVAGSLAEVVKRADVIWSCVQHQEAVQGIFDEFLSGDLVGKLFVESSTITAELTNKLAKLVMAKGGEFVAMPVFGEPSMAERGLLTCVPAGEAASVERIKPYLVGVVGMAVVDLSGEEPGNASLLKMIGNVLILSTMETVAELHVFAEKTGLGTPSMAKLLSTLFPRGPHTVYSGKMLGGEYHQGQAMVELHKAEALSSHVLALAKASGTSLKGYEVAVNHLAVAKGQAGPEGDILGIYGAVRVESGLPFKN